MEHLKHLNLDDAWRNEPFALPVVDARAWGPQLRFSAPPRLIAEFYREHETNLAVPFLLYGSGDFHYLTALRLRRVFAAEICAAQTAFRRGIRSPKNQVTCWRQDSCNQSNDSGKTLAVISAAIVGQAHRLPTRGTATEAVALQSIAS